MILIIEDEKDQRDLLCRRLRHYGFKCHCVSSYAEAHEFIAKNHEPIECSVCDWFTGDVLTIKGKKEVIRQLAGLAPVVVQSAHKDEMLEEVPDLLPISACKTDIQSSLIESIQALIDKKDEWNVWFNSTWPEPT